MKMNITSPVTATLEGSPEEIAAFVLALSAPKTQPVEKKPTTAGTASTPLDFMDITKLVGDPKQHEAFREFAGALNPNDGAFTITFGADDGSARTDQPFCIPSVFWQPRA